MKAAALANMDIGKRTKKATEATSCSCTYYVDPNHECLVARVS
jgi:hypothetical protein